MHASDGTAGTSRHAMMPRQYVDFFAQYLGTSKKPENRPCSWKASLVRMPYVEQYLPVAYNKQQIFLIIPCAKGICPHPNTMENHH